ncbi:unnamed protein product [Didymodactylos carnosus]|uniref:Notch n=1 Tax=Didymodactylos carnosus TaxID=1234261 RepID=A0A814D1G4_9BILA|nr:unnamed protein product [Didymodactylos carnosus]CAF0948918.1 unnamed protein product [Didymodactylos carnosus]CAF3567194.1 unnamed protein product [Didymodactylos carnosus]CAF3724754.1 unnamed protein product [Didymodactylos carnosus]
MTVQLCTNYCAEHGFPYAGLQFRSECYCGVAYTHSNFQKQSSCCTWLCSGSRNETCGGELCNSVYQTDLAVTSKNSQYVSLPSALLSGSTFSPSPCKSNPCHADGICSSTAVNNGTYMCKCKQGRIGLNCEHLDPCRLSNTCQNGQCLSYFNGSFGCLCQNNSCLNGGICDAGRLTTLTCNCPSQFYGERCELKCGCRHGGRCIINQNRTICRCDESRFYGDMCEFISPCASQPCYFGGTCLRNGTNFSCKCPPNKIGSQCEGNDPCQQNPCAFNSTCYRVNDISYKCVCDQVHTGTNCNEIVPMISRYGVFHSACVKNQDCNTTLDLICFKEKRCACAEGYTWTIDKQKPQTVGRCARDRSSQCYDGFCLNGGSCFVTDTSELECSCPPGYTGKYCDITIGPCYSNPCPYVDSVCLSVQDGYICLCNDNHLLEPYCNVSKYCPGTICNGRGICYNTIEQNSYCRCLEPYSGAHCTLIDTCGSNPCDPSATCIPMELGSYCACPPNRTGPSCAESINVPLCTSETCLNGGTCTQSPVGGFVCNCLVNYTGNRCEDEAKIEIRDPCATNPCLNAGTCIPNQVGGFTCNCLNGFTGNRCDDIEEPVYVYDPNSRTRTPITTNTLGSKTSRRTYREYANPGFVTTTDLLKE